MKECRRLKNKMELITIKNENGVHLVNARELHEFLGNKRQFTDWIKQRIEQYGFEENQDYSISQFCEKGRPKTEYAITLNMAKELSMVENNEKGKEARRYFIECENKYKNSLPQLSKELQAIFILDERTVKIESKVNHMENNMPLFNVECKELQGLVRKVGTKVLGGYKSPAYQDNSLRAKIYKDIQGQLKREFGVDKYEAIKRIQLEKAREIVSNYTVPVILQDQIILLNNQMRITEVI
ncbi:ORF6C domain-containing protein [Clostridium senegalense]